jgi:hypothetical protein
MKIGTNHTMNKLSQDCKPFQLGVSNTLRNLLWCIKTPTSTP